MDAETLHGAELPYRALTRMKNLQGAFLLRLHPRGPSSARLLALVSFFRMSPGPRWAAGAGARAGAGRLPGRGNKAAPAPGCGGAVTTGLLGRCSAL